MTGRPLFNQITIVGLGLVGGSLGMAIRRKRLARRLVGVARSTQTVRLAKAKGAIDVGTLDLREGIKKADLVILATHPKTILPLTRQIIRSTHHSFILSDVASTKGQMVRQLEKILPGRISFVGAHPMAGSERSGIQVADGRLFEKAICILTPGRNSTRAALSPVARLWQAVARKVVRLTPEQHDRLVAEISHLPHLVAAALVLTASPKALQIAGRGFADTTRIALSDAQLWSEILSTNSTAVYQSLDKFTQTLVALVKSLNQKKASGLLSKLKLAQAKRKRVRPSGVRPSRV